MWSRQCQKLVKDLLPYMGSLNKTVSVLISLTWVHREESLILSSGWAQCTRRVMWWLSWDLGTEVMAPTAPDIPKRVKTHHFGSGTQGLRDRAQQRSSSEKQQQGARAIAQGPGAPVARVAASAGKKRKQSWWAHLGNGSCLFS